MNLLDVVLTLGTAGILVGCGCLLVLAGLLVLVIRRKNAQLDALQSELWSSQIEAAAAEGQLKNERAEHRLAEMQRNMTAVIGRN